MPQMMAQLQNPAVQNMMSNPRAMQAMMQIQQGLSTLQSEAPGVLPAIGVPGVSQPPPGGLTNPTGEFHCSLVRVTADHSKFYFLAVSKFAFCYLKLRYQSFSMYSCSFSADVFINDRIDNTISRLRRSCRKCRPAFASHAELDVDDAARDAQPSSRAEVMRFVVFIRDLTFPFAF